MLRNRHREYTYEAYEAIEVVDGVKFWSRAHPLGRPAATGNGVSFICSRPSLRYFYGGSISSWSMPPARRALALALVI